jgi:A/G-specific adenine glycosylase
MKSKEVKSQTEVRERMLRTQLLAWYDAHARDLPWRESRDPYRVWVSEIMLQQTRVAAVIAHYHEFLRRFPTVEKLAGAREASVLAAWSGLGYYRRARMLHAAAKVVVRERGGKFPATAEGLRALPGVGPLPASHLVSRWLSWMGMWSGCCSVFRDSGSRGRIFGSRRRSCWIAGVRAISIRR